MEPLSSPPPHSTSSSSSKQTPQVSVSQRSTIKPSRPVHPAASVSISEIGKEIQQYTEDIANLPDVRQDRITEIKAALEKQTYSVSSQDLADKIIQDISTQLPGTSSENSS